MSSPKGFPSNQKNLLPTGLTNEFSTVIPKNPYRNALDTTSDSVFRVGAIQTAGPLTGLINELSYVDNTATAAKVGDIVRFETGALTGIEIPIVKVETNQFLLPIKDVAASGDTFYILRHVTLRTDASGQITVAPADISFLLDGVSTDVSEDTVVPANSIPLPVKNLNDNGTVVDFATQATLLAFSNKTPTGTFTRAYDLLTVVSKNANGDPLVIETRLATVLQQTATIVYDIDGDLQSVTVS